MPTTLPESRPLPRNNRLALALATVLLIEVLVLQEAGAASIEEALEGLAALAPGIVTCTAAEVPCQMLAP